ncbi:TRAP transporter small permease [Phaeovulum sp.]|uniref:TRAP transporter small permease n=1 Tax=Phaeovulum sp. TaxID=2934796 RepID=UPI003566D4D3
MAAKIGTVLLRASRMIVRAQLWVSMAALVLMMSVVVADVALRQLFNHPVQGAYDAVSILLGISVFYALGAVIAARNEIVIDLVDSLLPERAVAFLKRIAGLLSALVLAFIFFAMLTPMQEAYRYGDISLELRIPLWIVWVAALIGMLGGMLASIMMQFAPRGPGGMPLLDSAGGHAE